MCEFAIVLLLPFVVVGVAVSVGVVVAFVAWIFAVVCRFRSLKCF